MKRYFVYILVCNDNTLYTGICTDLEKRLKQHNGQVKGGAKYTEYRRPVKIVYFQILLGRSEALKREAEINKLTRIQKQKIIKEFKKN